MADGIYTAASGAVAQQQALEATAHNLANVGTAGFKGTRVSFTDVVAQLDGAPPDSGENVHVKVARLDNDFAQGPLRVTDNPLDLALSGPGFFVVDTPHGERLSRNGALSVRPDGLLQQNDGGLVQGHSGPVRVPLGGQRLHVDRLGVVFAGDVAVDRLRVVTVDAQDKLQRESGSMFAAGGQPLRPQQTPIQAGALEQANVNAVQMMTSLIAIQRAYESYHRSIETIRSSEQRLTSQVG